MSDSPDGASEPGFLASLKGLGTNLLGTIQTRLELLSVELQEEKGRLVELLLWTAATAFLGVIAVMTVTITVVVLAGDTLRPYVLVGFSLLYGLGAWGAARTLIHRLRHRPRPFASTLGELKKDRQWLTSRK